MLVQTMKYFNIKVIHEHNNNIHTVFYAALEKTRAYFFFLAS